MPLPENHSGFIWGVAFTVPSCQPELNFYRIMIERKSAALFANTGRITKRKIHPKLTLPSISDVIRSQKRDIEWTSARGYEALASKRNHQSISQLPSLFKTATMSATQLRAAGDIVAQFRTHEKRRPLRDHL